LAVLSARPRSAVVRRRAKRTRLIRRRAPIAVAVVVLTGVVVGVVFAGSPARLADGVHIAGVDVGGLTPNAAKRALERHAGALENVPIEFRVGGQSWRLTPHQLGVRADWGAAVASVRREGQGFGPVRGFRRLGIRFFGAEVAPPTQVYDPALQYELDRIAREIDTRHREASIVLHGLQPRIVPAGRVRSSTATQRRRRSSAHSPPCRGARSTSPSARTRRASTPTTSR